MWGAHALLEVRRRFLVGSGRPSMLMLVRSAAALATMRPVLLLRVCRKQRGGKQTEVCVFARARLQRSRKSASSPGVF